MAADGPAPQSGGIIETELKMAADDAPTLRRLAALPGLGAARFGPLHAVDEEDRYLDTDARHFEAAGWACRLRTRDGKTIVSLKGPRSSGASDLFHRRSEVEGPATATTEPGGWPPSAARDLVTRLAAGQRLRERVCLRQRRTERDVDIDGRRVGTLSLDRVVVLRDGRRCGRLLVVELELVADATTSAANQLRKALTAVRGLQPDPHSKLEHALAMAEVGPRA